MWVISLCEGGGGIKSLFNDTYISLELNFDSSEFLDLDGHGLDASLQGRDLRLRGITPKNV